MRKRTARSGLPPDGKPPAIEASKPAAAPEGRAAVSRTAAPTRPPSVGSESPGIDPTRPDRATQDAWVARLKARDAEALREVVAAFGERLTAVVSGLLRDRGAVEDIVQETFAKAWFRIGAFEGGSSLYTWLYRVAVNGAKDHMKSRARRPATSFDELPSRAGLAETRTARLEGVERRELRELVRDAIARLPRKFREILVLREIEGMSYGEIAETLALSLGTVESRLFRARQRLRELLDRGDPSAKGRSGRLPT